MMFDRILRTFAPAAFLFAAALPLTASSLAQEVPASSAPQEAADSKTVPHQERPEHAFVWMIEKKGHKPSFLFGTMHAGEKRFLKFNDTVKVMFKTADAVYTELEMDKMDEAQAQMASEFQLPAGKTVADYVDPDVLEKLEELFLEFGIPFAMLQNFRPVIVGMQLEVMPMQKRYGAAKALDERIYSAAKRAGKEVGGIEVIEEQMAAFNALTDAEAGHALRKQVDRILKDKAEGRDRLEELVNYYLLGDEKRIYEYMMELFDANDPLDVKAMEALLYKRNIHMAERAAQKIKDNPDKVFVFAFGTLHFIGPDSVVSKLRNAGYKVTRLTAPPKAKK